MQLRPYQSTDLASLGQGIMRGNHRQVFYGSTGYGKGTCIVSMLAGAYRKGKAALFIVDRITLVDDMSKRLDAEGIPHGVIQADHWRNQPYQRIQIASAQSLESRKLPEASLILVDECHALRARVIEIIQNTNAVVVGFTATPFTKGLGKVFDGGIIGSTTTNQLVKDGHLSPVRIFAAKEINMKGAKTVAGEWSSAEATKRGIVIIGDVVSNWVKMTYEHYGKPEKTLVFSASIKHGEALASEFRSLGYRFEQVSANTPAKNMRELAAELADDSSDLLGLVSVEKLAKGFDAPNVKIGIGCRPYRKSLSGIIQALGRTMRTYKDTPYKIWIDQCGNMARFMDDIADVFEHGVTSLRDGHIADKVHKEPTKKEKKDITCSCGAILMPWDTKCHTCGKERKRPMAMVENVAGIVEEVGIAAKRNKVETAKDKAAWLGAFRTYAALRDRPYKDGWCMHAYKERYGEFPRDPAIRNAPMGPIFHEAEGFIKHLAIKRAHERKRA